MPSQMSGTNGTNNPYHLNRLMNYSIIETNSGNDQHPTSDIVPSNIDSVVMNNNLPSINGLERGVSALSMTSNNEIVEEYYGYHRPISNGRRGSGYDNEVDAGLEYFAFYSTYSHLSQDISDEVKMREMYAREAQQLGFIVGDELEIVKAKSHRSVIQNTPDRITSYFKDRYGQQSDSSNKKTYLQLGVRVPTKEHVSEIVGKQGSKIKQIREKTGALITTPGEQEDHVFIIEAPPRTALHVAQVLRSRAEDISMSRTQESRRRSSCPNNSGRSNINKSLAITGFNQSSSKIILASGRIQVPKVIVGRIIGTQGSIITTIQRDTGTEIRSPPKEIGKPKHTVAVFEILVYQTANFTDVHEANRRVLNAKQLIAHVALHQLEKIRAEEAPYSNYQVQSSNSNTTDDEISNDSGISKPACNVLNEDVSLSQSTFASNKELLLTEQMRPFDWMWSDIERLDDGLANEVVDRILDESKKKTKTRSEPMIYTSNNLFTLGESDAISNRPRYSLPETKICTIPGLGLDTVYQSNIQSAIPYLVSDNFLPTPADFEFRAISGSHFSNSRDLCEPPLMPHLSSNLNDLSDTVLNCHHIVNPNLNRFVIDPNFQTNPKQYDVNTYAPWQYKSPQRNIVTSTSIKTYADSVRPSHLTTHGTIGDHLKKTMMPNNYRG